jgi:hypothetical protein
VHTNCIRNFGLCDTNPLTIGHNGFLERASDFADKSACGTTIRFNVKSKRRHLDLILSQT